MLTLFWTFFKIGLFTFGGGYAMISIVHEQVVERFGWLTDDEFAEIIAVAESTPGPIAINMATFVGYKQRKFIGSALATLGVVLPSFIIIYVIALFLEGFMQHQLVAYAFTGIKCAVAILIANAGWGMLKKMKKNTFSWVIFAAVFALMMVLDILAVSLSSVLLIIVGGVIGIFTYAVIGARRNSKAEEEDKND